MVSSLTTKGAPVTISQLSDYLTAQQFIYADYFSASDSGSATFVARRGGGRSSDRCGGRFGGGHHGSGGGQRQAFGRG